jgi:hypothetical protein
MFLALAFLTIWLLLVAAVVLAARAVVLAE